MNKTKLLEIAQALNLGTIDDNPILGYTVCD